MEEKREMAKKLIKRGVALNIVSEDTGLTQYEVENIKSEIVKNL